MSWFESAWTRMDSLADDKAYLAAAVGFGTHQVVYFATSMLMFFFQRVRFFDRYKIQKGKFADEETMADSILLVLANQLLTGIPPLVVPLFRDPLNMDTSYGSLPAWYTVLLMAWLLMVFEDAVHFFFHWGAHTPWYYERFHSWHHQHKPSFGVMAEYAHPLENLLFTIPFSLAILSCPHLAVLLVFVVLETYSGVVSHSGYDVWWTNPLYLLPGYQGAKLHDWHHEIDVGNYAPMFVFMDKLFGTYLDRNAGRNRDADEKKTD